MFSTPNVRPQLLLVDLPMFSFEESVLQECGSEFYVYLSESYFIDIGIPADYQAACKHFSERVKTQDSPLNNI